MPFLRRFWAAWKRFGQIMGDFVARVFLTLFYFTIFAPFGLGVRLLSDPLGIKEAHATWKARKTGDQVLDDARRLA